MSRTKKKFAVIIDAQNDFIRGTLPACAAQIAVDNIVRYLNENRAHVILTRDTHNDNYFRTQEGRKLPVKHCLAGTEGWQIDKDVMHAVETSEQKLTYSIVDKKQFGTFEIGDVIVDILNRMQYGEYVDYTDTKGEDLSITIMGFVTDICVISNALILKARFPEAEVTLLSDCCAGTSIENHTRAIEVMKACQIDISDAQQELL